MKKFVATVALCAVVAHAQRAGPCDPLNSHNCMLPFPSDFYLFEDASTPTGFRINMPEEASPVDRLGNHFSLDIASRADGYSPSTTMITYFPDVQLDNVPGWQDIARSLESDCPTVLMDYETGELLPHFAELDHTTPNAQNRAFMVWPTEMLKYGHKYVVAMRDLRNSTGLIFPEESFRVLRDGESSSNPDIEFRRAAYDDMFDRLEASGVMRRNLQMAWYFVTGSEEFITGHLSFVQQDAKKYIPEGGPEYTITLVTDNYNSNYYRLVEGEMSVPHYLTRNAVPGSELVLDEDGNPVYQGMVNVPFNVYIPHICLDRKCPIMNYGHGLLGTRTQAGGGTIGGVANTSGYIIVSVDMWGMSSPDVVTIAIMMLTDLGRCNIIPDRSVQGVLNHFLVVKLLKGDFANDPNMVFNGTSVVDTTTSYWWGISQGGILGSVVVAMSEDIQRGHLGVPGSPYPLLLARSVDFDPYFYILKARYEDSIDRILLLSLIGLLWDRAEPGGFAHKLREKQVLIDYSKGDAQVTYLGAYLMGRTAGAKMFVNNVDCVETTPIFGFEYTSQPFTGSAIVGYDYNVPCGPVENIPPAKETDTHGMPRNDVRNQEMAAWFFATGEMRDPCNGQGCYSTL